MTPIRHVTDRLAIRTWKKSEWIVEGPACPACGEAMKVVDHQAGNVRAWFRHLSDTDCPQVDNGRWLLEFFCEERNLLECYNVLCRILQLQYLDPDEFYGICKQAHFRRAWSFSALNERNLPYVLVLMKDVTAYETDGEGRKIPTHTQRSVMHSNRVIHILLLGKDRFPIWSSRRKVALLDPAIESERSNIEWIRQQPGLVEALGRFCREKGLCRVHSNPSGPQLPCLGTSGG